MAKLLYPPSVNGLQKTLDAQLDQGTTASMTLNNATNVQNKPGLVVINRIDTNGTEKDAADREYVQFDGVSGSTLTTLTRGMAGSTDQDHGVGSVVEFVNDVTQQQNLLDALALVVDESDNTAVNTTNVVTPTATQTLTNKTLTSPHLDTPDIDGDADLLDSDGNITVAGVDPWRTIDLPAPAWSPTTTDGCAALATTEAGTNDVDYKTLDFDNTSDEHAFVNFKMPASWDAGVIQFKYIWTTASGGAAETVALELAGRAYADNDAIDQARGTAVEVSDTWIADGDVHESDWSGDVTLNGTPAAGEWVHLRITRDVSSDDLGGDAKLIGVQIRYKQAQYSD